LEQAIIDSPPLQRLQGVKQLGLTYLVYRGATHARLAHVLGTLKVSDDLLNAVLTHRSRPHARPDLFDQWRTLNLVDSPEEEEGRVIVLVRLGALLHDLCHVAFGHTVEDDLQILTPHDRHEKRFDRLWKTVSTCVLARVGEIAEEVAADPTEFRKYAGHVTKDRLKDEFTSRVKENLLDPTGALHKELRPLILSKVEGNPKMHERTYPFAADLVGNTICADLLDYLQRDHLYCGLPMSLGTRFLSGLFVVPEGRGVYERRAAFSITRRNHERTDIVTELLKALRYRYELSERVLDHHAKLAADSMLGKAVELWRDAEWLARIPLSLAEAIDEDSEAKGYAQRVELGELKDRLRARGLQTDMETVDRAVIRTLEDSFLRYGDDALLQMLSELGETDPGQSQPQPVHRTITRLRTRASEIASAIGERRLFEGAGRASVEHAPAQELFDRYGDPAARRELERMAERYAEIDAPGTVVLWLPRPEMRLKLARVLVDYGGVVNTFVDYERPRAGRGSDIYDSHARLWSLWVFFDCGSGMTKPHEFERQKRIVLAFFARRLGIRWERYEELLGPEPSQWPYRVALEEVLNEHPQSPKVTKLIPQLEVKAAEANRERSTGKRPETDFAALIGLAKKLPDS
jgi:HD superfamily phosphohydrolase